MVLVGIYRWLLLAVLVGLSTQEFTLTVLHTGDLNANIEQLYSAWCGLEGSPVACFGGVARIMTTVREMRESRENVLLLDAGGQFLGTIWYYYYRCVTVKYFMQQLGYDAMAPSANEFVGGIAGIETFLTDLGFPLLSANLNTSAEPRLSAILPSVTLNIGGQMVGIIGYATPDTPSLVPQANIETISFGDIIEAVKAEAARLAVSGVNKIIVLGSEGILNDIELALQVPEVDIIVGGHSATFLYTGDPPSSEVPYGDYPYVVTQQSGKEVLIVHSYVRGKYLGHLDVTFSDDGDVISYSGNPIIMNSSVEEDASSLAEVTRRRAELEAFSREQLGYTMVYLEGGRQPCWFAECTLGNLLMDAIIEAKLPYEAIPGSWTRYSIALWNGGGIRTPINQGAVTMEQVTEAFLFNNYIEGIKIRGRTLLKMLEHSVDEHSTENPQPRFLHYSGLEVTYNMAAPVGQRVVEAKVRCSQCEIPRFTPLDLEAIYDVLTNGYLIEGGDGYDMIAAEMLELARFDTPYTDVVADYMKRRSPIVQGLEGRIKFVMTAEEEQEAEDEIEREEEEAEEEEAEDEEEEEHNHPHTHDHHDGGMGSASFVNTSLLRMITFITLLAWIPQLLD